ncbi:dihydroorotate dehydrogenase electron transfer subunit [Candidatus Parcubacteria bacterium]|nr:MAG: dihydroorotate dehydrogenase electron transfer subunit [Candidatus Parcubacteria bacterium]
MNNLEQPKIFQITDVIQETPDIKTFVFQGNLSALPGQFVMLWLPGIDSKPISIAYKIKEGFALSVRKVGPFTSELFKIKKGQKLGLQGPYGHGYDLKDYKKIICVGGGCGTPSVAFLAQQAKEKKLEVDFIIGARSRSEIPLKKFLGYIGIKIFTSTDDGSCGYKGFATDRLKELFSKNQYDCIYTCGPEIMMKKILDFAVEKNIGCQISMERFMACGIGICGQCCVDDTGWRVCQEGPVFEKEMALQISELGKYKRDKCGKKQNL